MRVYNLISLVGNIKVVSKRGMGLGSLPKVCIELKEKNNQWIFNQFMKQYEWNKYFVAWMDIFELKTMHVSISTSLKIFAF